MNKIHPPGRAMKSRFFHAAFTLSLAAIGLSGCLNKVIPPLSSPLWPLRQSAPPPSTPQPPSPAPEAKETAAPPPSAPAVPEPPKTITSSETERCNQYACFRDGFNAFGTQLNLTGTSLRRYLWVNVYSAALYLPPEANIEYRGGIPKGPKMLILVYHRAVEKQKIVSTIIDNVYSNPDVDGAKVKARFDALTAAFDPPLEGSRYYFLYLPDRGTALLHDGEEKVLIPGDDFAEAFFGMWLSSHERSPMREDLLGAKKSAR